MLTVRSDISPDLSALSKSCGINQKSLSVMWKGSSIASKPSKIFTLSCQKPGFYLQGTNICRSSGILDVCTFCFKVNVAVLVFQIQEFSLC